MKKQEGRTAQNAVKTLIFESGLHRITPRFDLA